MSVFYRIVVILLILAAGYTLYGIGHFKWMYHRTHNPKAEFQITGNKEADLTLVEFTNYYCGYCKVLAPVYREIVQIRKDVRFITRPIKFSFPAAAETEEGQTEPFEDTYTAMVIAAGLQGKFWEMHEAVLEYPSIEIPDSFFEETATLYGIDYEKMIADSKSKEVKSIIKENYSAFEYTGISSVPAFMFNGQIFIITEQEQIDLKTILGMMTAAEKSR